MTRLRIGALVAATAIIVAACGEVTQDSPAASTVASAPPVSAAPAPSVAAGAADLFGTAYKPAEGADGGTIILGDWQEPLTLQPFYAESRAEANVINATTDSLVTVTPDLKYAAVQAKDIPTIENGGVVVPGVDRDAMTVTWRLRDGLKWSDGEDLTCDDYRYAWEWALDPENSRAANSSYVPIKDWECVSDTHMVLHYLEVNESYITVATAPLPRHFLEAIPIKDQVTGSGFRPEEIAQMPTSGPFSYESVTPGQELRLKKNPNWISWSTGKGTHLDGLVWRSYPDVGAEIAGYRAGEIDLALGLAGPDVIDVADLGDAVQDDPGMTYEVLRLNWSNTENAGDATGGCSHNAAVASRGTGCPMADPAMREAFAYAIDKNEINERILGNAEVVANSNISSSAWFYADQPPATYDPATANEILEAGGWADTDGDGIREKNGLKAIVELCTTTRQDRQDTVALMAGWLKAVGIQGVPNAVDPTTEIFADYDASTRETPCNLAHQNYDVAEHSYSSSIDPFDSFLHYHSSQFRPSGANDGNVKDDELDAALDIVRTSVDFDEIKDAMATVQEIYVDQTVEIPLYYRRIVEIAGPVLGNYVQNTTKVSSSWNAGDWYREQ